MKVKSLRRVRLLATPWTAAYQAPPSMGFSRQEYWSGVPVPSPLSCGMWGLLLWCMGSGVYGLSCSTTCGVLVPRPGVESVSPTLQGRFLTTGPPGKTIKIIVYNIYILFCKYKPPQLF